MIRKIKNLFYQQQGNAMFFVSMAMVGLLSMTALVIDVGTVFATKAHLKKTANAAVLSGAQELVNTDSTVTAVIHEILQAHDEENSLLHLNIEQGHQVRVVLRKNVPLTFSKLLGFSHAPVEAAATAQILQMGRAQGAAPLGIDEAIPLVFYQTYKLKVDQTEVESGYFGVLALNGPGAETYEENLRNGYSGEIKIGDIIDTQTGNIAGKTISVINERINACPHPPGDYNLRDCTRILLVPVYRPYNDITNQLKQVEITGFAYFYIMEPMDPKDTAITGMFIKRVGTGFTDPNGVNRGAYSIKLIE